MTQAAPRKSDLGVRVLSAVVMVAVAGTALWLGGDWWTWFIAIVAGAVLWEWWNLTKRLANTGGARAAWLAAGLIYVGLAVIALQMLRMEGHIRTVLGIICTVIAVDVGAYFAGRTIGGPKIAPAISPNKTWAGLFGGIVGATAIIQASNYIETIYDDTLNPGGLGDALILGIAIAVIAQAGDFFESWMKRLAGVKDSGKLIPGHGGLLDRLDGLVAVLAVFTLVRLLFGA